MTQNDIFEFLKNNPNVWFSSAEIRDLFKSKNKYYNNVSKQIKKLNMLNNIEVKKKFGERYICYYVRYRELTKEEMRGRIGY